MVSRSLTVATISALFLGLATASSTNAAIDSTHLNFVTFSRGVSLPGGVQLAPGTYRFELPNSSQGGIVRVSSRNSETVYLTAFTHEVERPRSDDRREAIVTLGEVAPGGVALLAAWYPIGQSVGYQFVYGK